MSKWRSSEEINRLQKEIQQLREMNKYFQNNYVNNSNSIENQTDRYYYKPSPELKKFINRTVQNSKANSPNRHNFISSNQTRKNSKEKIKSYLNDNKRISNIVMPRRPPIKKGLFSYKPTFLSSLNQDDNSKQNQQSGRTNENCSALSQDLHFWDEDDEGFISSQKDKQRKPSTASINLNMYKINNLTNNTSTTKVNKENYDMNKISPIVSNNEHYINIPKEEDNVQLITRIVESDNFHNKPQQEKESRRMCIEYVKLLKKYKYNTYKPLEVVMMSNGISNRILNQSRIVESQQTEHQYMKTANFNENSHSSFIENNNKFIDSKYIYQSPQLFVSSSGDTINESSSLKQFSKFIYQMNDEKKDKLNMINFLCVPRKMKLVLTKSSQLSSKKFTKILSLIFVLTPNMMCYQHGLESYIFKFMEPDKKKFIGGFDLIKVQSCIIGTNNPKHFHLETFDGKKTRRYEIDADSLELCSSYVKSINYLNQLEKCKAFDYYNKKDN